LANEAGHRIREQSFENFRACLNAAPTAMAGYFLWRWGPKQARRKSRVPRCDWGEGAMAFKVGDAVRLKAGGAQMTVSKLFKSPEGREMVQCTWFDKKSRVHRAEFVMDSLEVADAIMLRLMQRERV
jgi:uncharacterized protein YodC (DUF2158 family)